MGKFLLGILAICCFTSLANSEYVLYKDPKQPMNKRIENLMSKMTLEEKIGQMTQIERSVASAQVMNKYFIGSVLSGGGSVPSPQASPQEWIDMVNDFQKGALSTRLGIPMIYGIDGVHGHNNVYNATVFPHNVGLGATRCVEILDGAGATKAIAKIQRWFVRRLIISSGLQGEVPPSGRKGVPYLASQQNFIACAKHYVGDGRTTNGINENNTVATRHQLLSIHMPAYYDSIIKGVSTVMISYSSWNGLKMHANRELITGFLKTTMRFRGFVISDWQGIDRITTPEHANYTYSIVAGVNAGIDMVSGTSKPL